MERQDQVLELIARMGDDLHEIRGLLVRLARDSFVKDLEVVASTPERQEMWRLSDGTLSNEEIAKKVGVSVRSVQYFVQDAEAKGLVVLPRRGFPKRSDNFNEIPATWKPFKKQQSATSSEAQPQEEVAHEQ